MENFTEYASYCKLHFLTPNNLLSDKVSISEKKKQAAKDVDTLFIYLLLEHHLTRMKNQWKAA